jgi:protein gp37
VIEQLTALIREHGFDAAHAIMVRPLGEGFQIVSGHNRVKAALLSGLTTIWAWPREMTDEQAYMQLVLANTQGELSPLERGLHALRSGMTVSAYATSVRRPRTSVQHEVEAARVAEVIDLDHSQIPFWCLVHIHPAKRWFWPVLIAKATRGDGLTGDKMRDLVRDRQLKDAPEQRWAFAWDRIAERVVEGKMPLDDVREMLAMFQHYVDVLGDTDVHPDTLLPGTVDMVLEGHNVASPSQLQQVLRPLLAELEDPASAQGRAVSLFAIVSLDQWGGLDDATKRILLDPQRLPATGTFNLQSGPGIEWAKYSWNPITGCLHDCPYCYARDIATLGNTARAFPHGFAPAFKPVHLNTPNNMRPPRGAAHDQRERNVFCGSMSDWWGRWVPVEWIHAVLTAIGDAPWWTFLTLTKFPKRMAEFELPANMWAGTTVDLQARVRNAEAAFADINASVRWLSIEPMLENLRFSRLDLFQWIVIGGASVSSRTPEWKPPMAWIVDLLAQAREAGVPVYMKPNLLGHRVLEMPNGLPVPQDYPAAPPSVFDYLRDKRSLEAKPLSERRSEVGA